MWARNLYHGQGFLMDERGIVYEGEWREGKFHGVGKHSRSGETYTGEFWEGERHGEGQVVRSAASKGGEEQVADPLLGRESIFIGQWCAGKRHGHGTAIYQRGEYEGEWLAGLRHGQGILSHGGYQLEGPWREGVPDESGQHTLAYPDGAKYTGAIRWGAGTDAAGGPEGAAATAAPAAGATQWARPEGRGLTKSPDGRLHDGQYRDGLPHGHGLEIDTDRSEYKGEFFRGQRHGRGQLQWPGEPAPQPVQYEHGALLSGWTAAPAEEAPPAQQPAENPATT